MTNKQTRRIAHLVINTSKMEDEIQKSIEMLWDTDGDSRTSWEADVDAKRATQKLEMNALFAITGQEVGFDLLETFDTKGKAALFDRIAA